MVNADSIDQPILDSTQFPCQRPVMSTIKHLDIDATVQTSTPSTEKPSQVDAKPEPKPSIKPRNKVDGVSGLLRGNTRGVQPIYTPARRAEIIDCLSRGLSQTKSALCAGIDEHTLRNWFKRDKKFAQECSIVRAKSEKELVSLIRGSDKSTGWQHFAWLLERGFGWVPRQEITGKDGGALIQTTISKETLAKIAKLAGPEEIKKIN